MHLISLWIGKVTQGTMQLFGRRGAAMPGLVVEKLDNQFMTQMLSKLPEGVIVISGTNGKTTSTKMLSAVLRGSGKKVLTNPTGSNFTRGVVASVVQHAKWSGKLDYDIAVIELDEAYAAKFVDKYKPRISLILNVMRDQMDRFGEIDYTAGLLSKVVKNTSETVILNRDDPKVAAMAKSAKCSVEMYGVADSLRDIFRSDEELHGGVKKVTSGSVLCQLEKLDDDKITTTILNKKHVVPLSLYGAYNAQNACAVIATAVVAGLKSQVITSHIKDVKPAFGRGERIQIGNKKVILQLVKNPGGFRHSLIGASAIDDNQTVIAINDDYADGRDVSWLWDVDFSTLVNKNIITTGVRAADMALRLSYDDIKIDNVEPDLPTALDEALSKTPDSGVLHIYTTYTAMLKLRQLIAGMTEVEKV